jgi:hypothetical protein
MTTPEDDPLLSALGALPEHDVEPAVAARIARRARAELAASARTAPWLAALTRFYARLVEAPLVLAACALYLVWLGGVLGDTGFSAAERARASIEGQAADSTLRGDSQACGDESYSRPREQSVDDRTDTRDVVVAHVVIAGQIDGALGNRPGMRGIRRRREHRESRERPEEHARVDVLGGKGRLDRFATDAGTLGENHRRHPTAVLRAGRLGIEGERGVSAK